MKAVNQHKEMAMGQPLAKSPAPIAKYKKGGLVKPEPMPAKKGGNPFAKKEKC